DALPIDGNEGARDEKQGRGEEGVAKGPRHDELLVRCLFRCRPVRASKLLRLSRARTNSRNAVRADVRETDGTVTPARVKVGDGRAQDAGRAQRWEATWEAIRVRSRPPARAIRGERKEA